MTVKTVYGKECLYSGTQAIKVRVSQLEMLLGSHTHCRPNRADQDVVIVPTGLPHGKPGKAIIVYELAFGSWFAITN